MGLFRYGQSFHMDCLLDREYEPMALAALSNFSRLKAKIVDGIGNITPEEKNQILRDTCGYSKTKVAKIIAALERLGEIETNQEGDIIIKEFDKTRYFFSMNKETLQYLFDTFGKDSLAAKAYIYLAAKWKAHEDLGVFNEGYCFTLGGKSNMSLLKNLGYKSAGTSTKERLVSILEILENDRLIQVIGPHMIKFDGIKMNNVYSLIYLKRVDKDPSGKFFTEFLDEETKPKAFEPSQNINVTERFDPYLPKFRNYYLEQDSPRYNFVNDLDSLGQDCVLVLYEGIEDNTLIKFLRDYPDKERIEHGRIMFSTLCNQDDDVDDIWSIEPFE